MFDVKIPEVYQLTKDEQKMLGISSEQKMLGISSEQMEMARAYRSNTYSFSLFYLDDQQIDCIESILNRVAENKQIKLKREQATEFRHSIGTMKRYRDIQAGKFPKATNVESAKDILLIYVAIHAPGCKLYTNIGNRWYPLFIAAIYTHTSDRTDYAVLKVEWSALDEKQDKRFTWVDGSVRGKTAPQLLAMHGLFVGSPEIINSVSRAWTWFAKIAGQVGKQVYVTGPGFSGSAWSNSEADDLSDITCFDQIITTEVSSGRTVAVIDTIRDDKDIAEAFSISQERAANYDITQARKRIAEGLGPVIPDYIAPDDIDAESEYSFPYHPLVPVFDLLRHRRYVVHALDLVEYKYNTELDSQLILPADQKRVLKMLSGSSGSEFKDIVDRKSGGSVILLAGKPGVGKTLSAEVFSETNQRPLYRVQCSQLGMSAEEIEVQFHTVFRRANRWNAIVLLDEADLYISERGSDINQAGIVCVFLRTLETVNCVLFMTTNRPESVDDAIASRCIARIDVTHPDANAAMQIWKTLQATSGANISEETMARMVSTYPQMAGRDIKQTIKLAMTTDQGEIDFERLKFCIGFHPNRGNFISGNAPVRAASSSAVVCPKCGSDTVSMFDSDLDWCHTCRHKFQGI